MSSHAARLESSERLREEWRPIGDFPGYEVSSIGRVRSLSFRNGHAHFDRPSPLILKANFWWRYLQVCLCRDGKVFTRSVHRLVLVAFHGPRPKGREASHLNGDQFDNRYDNLAWMTHRANVALKALHGTRQDCDRNGRAVLTREAVAAMRSEYTPGAGPRLARKFGISKSQFFNVLHRRQWEAVP